MDPVLSRQYNSKAMFEGRPQTRLLQYASRPRRPPEPGEKHEKKECIDTDAVPYAFFIYLVRIGDFMLRLESSVAVLVVMFI